MAKRQSPQAKRESPQDFWDRLRTTRAGSAPAERPAPPVSGVQGAEAPPTRMPVPDARADEAGAPSGARAQPEPEEASAPELVKQLTEQTKTLVKQEMRLAQVELQEKGKKVGIGAGLFGAGGLVAFFGAATLIAAIVLLISTALAAWLSALIVAVLLLAIAGVAALKGKKEIEKATPPVPEQAVDTVKEDVQHVKEKAKEGKQ